MPALSKPARQMAALGLLAAAVLAAWTLVLGPVIAGRFEVRERIVAERTLLGRLQAAIAAPVRGAAGLPATAEIASTTVLLSAASEAIALAALQSSVTTLAAQQGARPQTTRMLPLVERDDMRLAGVHIEVTVPIATIQRLLHAIESARPLLIVEHLTLEALSAARSGGTDDGSLRASLHVYGVLARTKEGESRAP